MTVPEPCTCRAGDGTMTCPRELECEEWAVTNPESYWAARNAALAHNAPRAMPDVEAVQSDGYPATGAAS